MSDMNSPRRSSESKESLTCMGHTKEKPGFPTMEKKQGLVQEEDR